MWAAVSPAEIGAWCGAILAIGAVAALASRAIRHVIRDEMPSAMAAAIPDVTRQMVREEVERAVEPAAALLRAELKPNGGSSFADEVDRRFTALEQGQTELMDAITTPIPRKRTSKKQ